MKAEQIVTSSKKRKADNSVDDLFIQTSSVQEEETKVDFFDFDNNQKQNAETNIFSKATDMDLERMKQDILEENIYLIQELEKSAKSFSIFS